MRTNKDKLTGDFESQLLDLQEKLEEAEEQIFNERREAKETNDYLKAQLESTSQMLKTRENELHKIHVSDLRMTGAVPDNELGNLVGDLRQKLANEMARHGQTRAD